MDARAVSTSQGGAPEQPKPPLRVRLADWLILTAVARWLDQSYSPPLPARVRVPRNPTNTTRLIREDHP
ncbi:MAG: hypothetical protein WAS07_12590 [Micropruina sp.]